MESNNIKQVMNHYLQEMVDLYQGDDSPGISDYCSVLKGLLYSSLDFINGNIQKDKVEIELNQKLLQGAARKAQSAKRHAPCPGCVFGMVKQRFTVISMY